MRITKIQIHNFLGLSYVKVVKLGKLVRITGENGIGKSSILIAITEAFKGSGVKPTLIKNGEVSSEIMIELDDRIEICRTLTATSNDVKVTIDGALKKSPATYLANLVNVGLGVNPIKFFEAKPPAQRAIILKALNCPITRKWVEQQMKSCKVRLPLDEIDWNEHGLVIMEDIRQGVYDERRLAGQRVSQLEKSIDQDKVDLPEGVDPKRWDGFDLKGAVTSVTEAQEKLDSYLKAESDRNQLRERLQKLKDEKTRIEGFIAENIEAGKALKVEIDSFERPDIEAMQIEMGEYETFLSQQATLEGVDRKRKELEGVKEGWYGLDQAHVLLKSTLPQALIAKAEIPIEGLMITSDGISVDGTPLEQLSAAERVVFAVTLARELCGELKVVCVDGMESIVGKTRKMFEVEMESDDIEYFIAEATANPPELAVDGGTLETEPEAAS